MKSDPLRSYATSALRLYAALGKPDERELEKKIYEKFISFEKNPQKARFLTEKYRPLLLDIKAVRETISFFSNFPEILSNIEDIYFFLPKKPLKSNEVTSRVRFSALAEGVSERTVFSRLKKVRRVFAEKRGLFCGEIPDFLK